EKLFRGDTEFALMERVRKAEATPPSKFNRRVPPELDAMVLRALARDVQDRYQSGQEFAADLRRLIEGYRFNPDELKELVRGLFRQDYQKELDDVDACKASQLSDHGSGGTAIIHDEAPEIEVISGVSVSDVDAARDAPGDALPPAAAAGE